MHPLSQPDFPVTFAAQSCLHTSLLILHVIPRSFHCLFFSSSHCVSLTGHYKQVANVELSAAAEAAEAATAGPLQALKLKKTSEELLVKS